MSQAPPEFTEEENWSCKDKMKLRRERIDEICTKLLSPHYATNETIKDKLKNTPHLDNIYINLKRKMGVCIPHKVGSQTWRYFFHRLDKRDSNINDNESRIQFQNELPDDIVEYYIAFQARHPLERLLSSYRFIFEREQMRTSVIEMNKEIFKRFPSETTTTSSSTIHNKRGLKIEEIQLSNKKNVAQNNLGDEDVNWYKVVPSFKQFVQYVSDVDASGEDYGVSKYRVVNHWLPYYFSCNPCYQGNKPDYY